MNVDEKIRTGLQSTPKYIPVWYLYDKQGNVYAERLRKENPYYYMLQQEMLLLKGHVQDMVSQVASPCVLFDLGSGDCAKSRIFIDAILEKQPTLRFIPVDTSKELLLQSCEIIARDYGSKLDILPIPDDYSVGIDEMRNIEEKKLIIWIGGGLQIQPYDVQVNRLQHISQVMSENDSLIISVDINQNAEEAEKAYLDPAGITVPFYHNGFWRLNREYGSNVDTRKLELQAKFVKNTETTATSYVWVRAKAKEKQSCDIPGLGMSLTLEKGEYINMFEGEGLSCKYTIEQMRSIVQKGNLHLDRTWIDPKQRVALCCIVKKHSNE